VVLPAPISVIYAIAVHVLSLRKCLKRWRLKMPNGDQSKEYWLLEANKHLAIALIGIPDANRVHVERAIECLGNYQQMIINERKR
jgi:hypothetical protein